MALKMRPLSLTTSNSPVWAYPADWPGPRSQADT